MIVTLLRRRAIQGSEKITPVDQPGSCWSHRQRPALISTPDTLAPVTQSWHLLSRYQASARTVNGARTEPVTAGVVPVRRITGIR